MPVFCSTRNLIASIALALLSQVAYAQETEYSFESGKVPAQGTAVGSLR